MFWFILPLLWIGTTVLSALLRPPTAKTGAPRPSGLGDFTLPTAEEGRCIPLVRGTVKVPGINCLYYGGIRAESIKTEISGGLFGPKHAWIGFRYFMDQMIGICLGPVDELLDLRFDDKSVGGAGVIEVVDGHNELRFGNVPPPWYVATIPPGFYYTPHALAIATEAAMIAAYGTLASAWKVVYGYHFIPGHSATIHYRISYSTSPVTVVRTANMNGIYTTGADVALALERAMNYAEFSAGTRPNSAVFNVAFNDDTGKFTITFHALHPQATGFGMITSSTADSGFPHIGFWMGRSFETIGTDFSVTSDYPTSSKRYMFAFGGAGGKLDLDDPATTCKALFGMGSGTPTLEQYMCVEDRDTPQFLETYAGDGEETRILVNAPGLFGGTPGEGGVAGVISLYPGTRTQLPAAYLEQLFGVGLVPAYRSLCYTVDHNIYIGNSSYLKTRSYTVRATPNPLGLTGGHENIDGDWNPASGIYEILTDAFWGLGMDPSLIDVDSLIAAADTLFDEGLGISLNIDTPGSAFDVGGEILKHIDGLLVQHPTTGKLALRLIRPDYDPDELEVFDEADVTSVEFSRPSWGELRNVVRVRYIDRGENFTERIAQAMNSAAWSAMGGDTSVEDLDFRGFSNATNGQIAAERALRTLGYPVAPVTITGLRRLAKLRPGDVAKLNWSRLGISGLIFRVGTIDPGEPRDNQVSVFAAEDIFGISTTVFSPPAPTGFVDPALIPMELEGERLLEAPYAVVAGEDLRVMTLGGRALIGPGASGYQVWSDDTGGTTYAQTQTVGSLTPTSSLNQPLVESSDTIVLDDSTELDFLSSISLADFKAGKNVLLIDDELIAWKTITNNDDGTRTLSTIARGVMDTTPRPHGSGARVLFVSSGFGFTADGSYGADLLLAAKLLPYNGAAVRPLASVTRLQLQTVSRALRPYVPTAVALNGDSYPEHIDTGTVTVSWSHRDRLGTWEYDDSGATGAAESGVTYTLEFYGEDGTLKKTYSGLTGTSQTWTSEISDSGIGRYNSQIRIVLKAVSADPLDSYQAYDYTVSRQGASASGVATMQGTGRVIAGGSGTASGVATVSGDGSGFVAGWGADGWGEHWGE